MTHQEAPPARKPRILDLPSFKLLEEDAVNNPFILQAEHVDLRSSRTQTTNAALWQPHRCKIAVDDEASVSLTTRPIIGRIRLPTSACSDHHSNPQTSYDKETIVVNPETSKSPESTSADAPARSPAQIPRRSPSPLPPSRIRVLKSAYATHHATHHATHSEQTHDHLNQIRLSRAVSLDAHLQKTLENQAALSQLPFAGEDTVDAAQTSWIESRSFRDARIHEKLTQEIARQHHAMLIARKRREEGEPIILRCGEKGSGLPILVCRITLTGTQYELYDEDSPMPREIRYQLLEVWGRPYGEEGKHWEVDWHGRVWVGGQKLRTTIECRRWDLG